MTFENLGLDKPILKAIAEKGYSSPSPIQAKAIPAVLTGGDVMAAAQTGTGKTAGFTLPILQLLSQGKRAKPNQARVLVLTPTRELAAQVSDNIHTYGKHLQLSSTVVYGGVKINPQMMRLRKGADILVATPGRLLDLYDQNAIGFEQLEVLVLDEADRMLDMGFIHDIRKILNLLPRERQNLMFSATFSDEIRKLAKTIVRDPIEISVTPPNSTVDSVKQWLVPVDKKRKPALLIHMIKEYGWDQVLVFSRTKHGANRLATQLTKSGVEAAAIHGNKSQGARTRALADFKAGKVHVLVATDIAARGIDISQLPYVVNFDLPNVPEDYVHRIGRTGRAGAEGEAVSLVAADEIKQLKDIERLIKKLIDREYEPGFEPDHEVPESKLDTRPLKPKKPKKPKKQSQSNNRDQQQDGSASDKPRRNHSQKSQRRRGRDGQHSNSSYSDSHHSNSKKPAKQIRGKNNSAQSNSAQNKKRDANGDVDGNRAGVETHHSDNYRPDSGNSRPDSGNRFKPKKNHRNASSGKPNGRGRKKPGSQSGRSSGSRSGRPGRSGNRT